MTPMLSVTEARARILALMAPVGREVVPITDAVNRVIAEPITALRTQPPFNASAMDGYAVRASEVSPGASLTITGESAAGHPFNGAVPPGHCIRIFTGAPAPEPLDRIIIQEDVTREGNRIILNDNLDPGPYLRRAGLDFNAGDTLLTAPRRLTPENIALLAANGTPFVTVHRKPRVTLLATGDELVLPGAHTSDGAIISSNNFGLRALIEALHASAEILPIAADDTATLQRLGREGAQSDLFVTLGGASVGDHDLIRPALKEIGLELDLYKIAMRPGKPLMAGMLGGTPMLGLPGNPVSSMVCGRIFMAPAIDRLAGLAGDAPTLQTATLTVDLPRNGPREHYMRACCQSRNGTLLCTPFDSQDSSRLALLSEANALAMRPADENPRKAGDPIQILIL